MAAAFVFATYELLEQMLLELPLRQLLLSERINEACCDVIGRATEIQKALFLVPNADTAYPIAAPSPLTQLWRQTTEWYSASEEESKSLRGLRQEHERVYVDRELDRLQDDKNAEVIRALKSERRIQYVRPIVNNSLTINIFVADGKTQDLNPMMETYHFLPSRKGCGIFLARSRDQGSKYAMNTCNPSEIVFGSWGSMFATQPPVNRVRVLLLDSGKSMDMQNWLRELYDAGEESRDYAGRMDGYLYHWHEWVHTAADVDSSTGYEMLRMLEMIYEGTVDEGLLWQGTATDEPDEVRWRREVLFLQHCSLCFGSELHESVRVLSIVARDEVPYKCKQVSHTKAT